MPGSSLTAHILDAPGARLYYERRGSGPLLLMVGSPMDSTGFAGQLGTPVVQFPGDHGGFAALSEQFGHLLDQILTQAA